MQTAEELSDEERLLAAEENLRRNAALARQIAGDIAATLRRTASSLPFRPEVFLKQRTTRHEFDARYQVGVARTFRSGLFRKQRHKLLQIHLERNIQSAVARISVPDGHRLSEGVALFSRNDAARSFSTAFLADLLAAQINASDEAFDLWRSERPSLLPLIAWK